MKNSLQLSALAAAVVALASTSADGAIGDGITVYYNFDNNLEDHAGDLSGNANTADDDLTFAAGHAGAYGAGLFGSAGYLGSGPNTGHAEAPFSPDVDGGTNGGQVQAITVQWWGKANSFDAGWQAGVARGEGQNWRFHRQGSGQTMAWQGGGGDIHGGANVNDGQWHHFVGTSDVATNTRTLYIDGVQMASQTLGQPINSDTNLPLMVGENPQANAREWNGEIDDVAIWNRALSEAEIQEIYNAGQAGNSLGDIVVPPEDADADTLPDRWEISWDDITELNQLNGALPAGNGPGDGSGDWDNDGASDKQEYDARTNPTDEDTDGDGINDGSELAGGTDPTDQDTDGDGLSDAVETNTGIFAGSNDTGTDPTKSDTDGDGTDDAREINLGFDPTDDNDFPSAAISLWAWWPLNEGEGNLAMDISGNERHAVVVRTETGGLGPGGASWIEDPECGWVLSFNGDNATGSYAIMTAPGDQGSYGALPLFTTDADNAFTWSLWIKAEDNQANNDIILGNRYQPGGGDFAPREFIKFDSNNFEFDTSNVRGVDYADIVGEQLGRWVHHVIVKDGAAFTYYRDGIQAGTGAAAGSQNNQQPLFFGGQGNFEGTVTAELWRGAMFDVRLFDGALTESDVANLFNNKGQFGAPLDTYRFVVSSNDGGANIDFEWNSVASEVYSVVSSADPDASPDPSSWSIVPGLENLSATPPLNRHSIARPAEGLRFYKLVAGPVPPLFFDDLEEGAQGWTTAVNDANGNTQWELGTPAGSTGPFTGADGSTNAWCTNLGDYGTDSDISLRTPVIDLTGVAGAQLSFVAFRDGDGFDDTAEVRFLRAGDLTALGAATALDMTIIDSDYTNIEIPVDAAALGESVIVEIRFMSNASVENYSGLTIDNVRVDITQ